MPNITIEIIEGAQLDHAIIGSTLLRVAHVTGLDQGIPADPAVLIRSLQVNGMPQFYDPHPAAPDYICNRHVSTPIADSECQVIIYYYRGVSVLSTWVQTESTTTINDTTQILSDGTPLTISRDFVGVQQLGSQPAPVIMSKRYVATASYPRAVKQISFDGSVFGVNLPGAPANPIIMPGAPGLGSPPTKNDFSAAVNKVNSVPWRGYGVGYWWMNDFKIVSQNWGITSTVHASMLTKQDQDWSKYEFLRDTNTGKLLSVDPSVVQALASQPYTYGVTPGTTFLYDANGKPVGTDENGNPIKHNAGVIKIGPYHTADFFSLFGS